MGITQRSNPNLGNLQMVAIGSVLVENDGSNSSTTAVEHGLGFRPFMIPMLNDATVTGIPNAVSVPLPTYIALTIDTGTPQLKFLIWLQGMTDSERVYFQMLNSTGSPAEITVTYYLFRASAQ